jgi:ribosomal protein S18 acetylase RimI-like enzyme
LADTTDPTLRFRPGRIDDVKEVGKIMYDAFSSVANKHGFPSDFPTIDVGIGVASYFLSNSGFYSVVAEDIRKDKDKIVGSNFLDERSNMVAGVGPITVDPNFQNKGAGRRLMKNVMERAVDKNFPAIRLLQASYNNRSLSLYASLGFEIREPISAMQGKQIHKVIPGRSVRMATESDLKSCNTICKEIHGHDRNGELRESIKTGIAKVVLCEDRITGYTTGLTFFNHSVGYTNDDIMALIGSTTTINDSYGGPGILIPSRNTQLLRWCLDNGLKLVQQLTLMTIGLYNEPAGSYMPSVLY